MTKIMNAWPAVARSGRHPCDCTQLAPGALRPAVVEPGSGVGDQQGATVNQLSVAQELGSLLEVAVQGGGCAGVQWQQAALAELAVAHGQDVGEAVEVVDVQRDRFTEAHAGGSQ